MFDIEKKTLEDNERDNNTDVDDLTLKRLYLLEKIDERKVKLARNLGTLEAVKEILTDVINQAEFDSEQAFIAMAFTNIQLDEILN